MVPIYLERWYLQPSRDTCLGCRYLAGSESFIGELGRTLPCTGIATAGGG